MSNATTRALKAAKIASIVFFPFRLVMFCMAFWALAAMGQLRTEKDLAEMLRDFFPTGRTA